MKEVAFDDFLTFLREYPNRIEQDVSGISEPPFVGYYDFSIGKGWEALVACYHLEPDVTKRKYKIRNDG